MESRRSDCKGNDAAFENKTEQVLPLGEAVWNMKWRMCDYSAHPFLCIFALFLRVFALYGVDTHRKLCYNSYIYPVLATMYEYYLFILTAIILSASE